MRAWPWIHRSRARAQRLHAIKKRVNPQRQSLVVQLGFTIRRMAIPPRASPPGRWVRSPLARKCSRMFSTIHFERFLYHLLVASHSFPLTSRRPIEHRHASRRSHLSPLAWRRPSTFSPPPGRAPRRRPTRRTGWRRRTYWRGVVRRRTSGFTPSESSRTLSRAVSGRCRNDRRRWRATRARLARGADDRRRRGWARFDAR
jgi:hypothetical protein